MLQIQESRPQKFIVQMNIINTNKYNNTINWIILYERHV